ncbi:MAG: type II toxin-antitoxin system RatA family toxin [Pseudomonadota bacterium]|nr:type II toxin-antitoxin system RatA family toxin [Pseudomonadota bacterium]
MTLVTVARRMPFRPADLYAIIVNVEAYQEFLPLCGHSRVWNRSVDGAGVERFCAELSITYDRLAISERLRCDVVADPRALTVTAASRDGPVRRLDNRWALEAVPEGTDVIFRLDYVMASRMLQFLLSGLFDYAMRKIMTAFEERARTLLTAVAVEHSSGADGAARHAST